MFERAGSKTRKFTDSGRRDRTPVSGVDFYGKMIQRINAEAYCSEDISKIENYEQAVNDDTQMWQCHHRREIDENKTRARLIAEKLYYYRPAAELIFLTRSQHVALHNKGNKYGIGISPWIKGRHHSEKSRKKMSEKAKHRAPISEETRKKLSISRSGEKNPMFGKHHSEETKKKCAAAFIGTHWWNNGIVSKQKRECPGEGWVRGRLKRK